MYDKRIKIYLSLCLLLLLAFVLRLMQLQLFHDSSTQDRIAQFKRQLGRTIQLKTLRGKILDRNGKILAQDSPVFELFINYEVCSILDERVRKAYLVAARQSSKPEKALALATEQIQKNYEILFQIIEKSSHFGPSRQQLEEKISKKNNEIWNIRTFQAWRKLCTHSDLFKQNQDNLVSVKSSDFLADFEQCFPDPNISILKVCDTNIAEMHESWPLLQFETPDDILTAQIEFMYFENVRIEPSAKRIYPYNNTASQTIGWVSLAREYDKKLFADDRFLRYLSGEISGLQGIEYLCESVLRGRRGEIFYDIDGKKVQTENQFGSDVKLTIDIDLQKQIEDRLAQHRQNPDTGLGLAAVVLDVQTAQILALASLPSFDLNRARYDYDDLINDKNNPLLNRAINETYPPGSSIKPFILAAALQAGVITPTEIISCPPRKPPSDWPQCWINRNNPGACHDNEAPNYARNAVKGSCNIYFSHIADRLDSRLLQKWLFNFGFGRKILYPPASLSADPNDPSQTGVEINRNFLQSCGTISSSISPALVADFNSIPPLDNGEKRYFGIGHGSLRTSPLQVANAMAALAREGLCLPPKLIIADTNDKNNIPTQLELSRQTLDTIYEGMYAVVNERGGTAYNAFAGSNLRNYGLKIYGKTGSTEKPETAWFAGFAKDSAGRCIAVVVVVEGGKQGSTDAAPIARDIISFCISAGHLAR